MLKVSNFCHLFRSTASCSIHRNTKNTRNELKLIKRKIHESHGKTGADKFAECLVQRSTVIKEQSAIVPCQPHITIRLLEKLGKN